MQSAQNSTHVGPGTVIDGRYRIEDILGQGGMATVFRATHLLLDQTVAIKVVLPQMQLVSTFEERFLREARAATALKGDHIVRVSDVGTLEDGSPYFVMEYLEGQDLDALILSGERVPAEVAVDYVLQACEAVAEVHGHGIVHRDLKPANLFLTRGADGMPKIKLIDFGISSQSTSDSDARNLSLTDPESIMGSPKYMSPEQFQAATFASTRSDIWGLGAVLYELLTSRPPYDGESCIDIFIAANAGPPARPSEMREDVPESLDEVLFRCLRPDPFDRYADVADLAAALAPFGGDDAEDRVLRIRRVLRATRGERNGVHTTGGRRVTSHVRRRSRAEKRIGSSRRKQVIGIVAVSAVLAIVAFSATRVLAGRAESYDRVEVPTRAIVEVAPKTIALPVEPRPVVSVAPAAPEHETVPPPPPVRRLPFNDEGLFGDRK